MEGGEGRVNAGWLRTCVEGVLREERRVWTGVHRVLTSAATDPQPVSLAEREREREHQLISAAE